MLMSLVVCTYNNASSLAITLAQLSGQVVAYKSEIELIIVNNNSSDATNEVVVEFEKTNTPFKYFIEGRQGLSHARNLGVQNAKGQYILFTDDDAEIQSEWISNYLHKIKQYQADCIFGRILVIWDKPQPWWYDNRYQGFFAAIDHGNESFLVNSHSHPFFGKNFCVKKSIIDDVGGFDPKFGRKGDELLGGEESVIFDYLIKHKKIIWYFVDIDVGHRLKDREYTEANIRKQHLACAKPIIWFGETRACADDLWNGRSKTTLKNHIIFLVESAVAYVSAVLNREKKERFFHQMEIRRAICVIWYWIRGV